MIKLCFPTVTVAKSYLHKEIDFKKGMTAEYFDMCKKEIDAMRVRDPQGRKRSNAGHGWQSNDGIDTSPIFTRCMREIRRRTELIGHRASGLSAGCSDS